MDQITLKNFRCFRGEQTVRLAPLTLLVGENSTGKTSFMAMIRALWNVAHSHRTPDFKEEPYDLGSFDEIAHHRGGRGGRAETFEAGCNITPKATRGKAQHADNSIQSYNLRVTFKKRGTVPRPVKMRLSREKIWVEFGFEDQTWQTSFKTPRGTWEYSGTLPGRVNDDYNLILPYFFYLSREKITEDRERKLEPNARQDSVQPNDKDLAVIDRLIGSIGGFHYPGAQAAYASAPVRSKPRRTYDPSRPTPDPQGDYVPMYLASIYFQEQRKWRELKKALERFGQDAGLFDEISIKRLGSRDSEPFQVQVRRFDGKLKGPDRNLIDVGYGISQVLPVITELLRDDTSPMYLLQQPEVHLHPSAQAALGSFFCQVAAPERQLIVETHSDHLLDRIRMDVRDRTTPLKPEDVSILFFERGNLDVSIHSLRVDQEGNILSAPKSYRRFFLQETQRSLGV